MKRAVVGLALLLAAAGCRREQTGADSQPESEAEIRAVTVGGGITEIAHALGAGEHILGVDSSSLYPKEATALPQVGSHRNIAAEGVLSLRPTVIIADHGVGPAAAFEQLGAAGVEIVRLSDPPAGDDPADRIAYAAEHVDGFKPLTAEAVAAARPEVVLMLDGGVSSLGGSDAVFDLPGLRTTPASATRRLVTMDDLFLLGFGPRTGAALRELGEALHREPPR